jgi:hypothetical protein
MLDASGFNGGSPDSSRAKRGFLAWDSANPDNRDSYKLPFADMVDGELKAMSGGLAAAVQRLPRADLRQDVADEARSVLDGYESRRSKQEETKAMADKDRQEGAAAAAASAAKIVALCVEAGVPALAVTLLNEGLDLEQATSRVDGAKEIKAAVELAQKIFPQIDAGLADKFIAAGTSLAAAQTDLLERISKAGPGEISSQHDPLNTGAGGHGGGRVRINAADIYAERAAARAKRRPTAA